MASKGMNLRYIPPSIQEGKTIVKLEQEDIEEKIEKWRMVIILYGVGASPSIGAVERFLVTQWRFAEKPRIYYHNDDCFVIRFNNRENKEKVLLSDPSTLNNRPVIIKEWAADFNFQNEVLKTIPIWVKFPNLPLSCWGMKALSKICSGLGTPVYADECTTNIARISYARVLIEMDITRTLPKSIVVQDPKGGVFEQKVQYDWQPEYCTTCLQIGHNCKNKNEQKQPVLGQKGKQAKPIQVWRRADQVKTSDKKNEQIQEANGKENGGKDAENKEHAKATVPQAEGWTMVKTKSASKMAKNGGNTDKEIGTTNGFSSLERWAEECQVIGPQEFKQCARGQSSQGVEGSQGNFPPLLR
ncbi:PREDICTED: uncharacterized protein LOC109234651 [Nicotiana attenuata]|uniref:uncharacterized protein LOC109234651 n=1 Tax=Nicotiana attenuata TaxID=49451 RepID=UPI0009055B2F|nr:PREDICTED: uncharacterized protein LOC109234651 [Nicotiana attenuata]